MGRKRGDGEGVMGEGLECMDVWIRGMVWSVSGRLTWSARGVPSTAQ